MHLVRRWIGALAVGWLGTWGTFSGTAEATTPWHYNRDIRPLLSEHCFQCHGPDAASRQGKLRLDRREDALARGVFKVEADGQSPLVRRVFSADPDEQMPPPKAHKVLSAEHRERLKQWVNAGAPYEAHWSFLPVQRPEVPTDSTSPNPAPPPVDAFVQAGLRARGLTPAPEADRRTLLRRLSLDLTGLPPTPREVEDFVRDRRAWAYERQVERLLASPHFGERMAVPWLDAVRFADTVGYHGDQNQRIFPYRDYVIAAFANNKPFDDFTREQIAGDLLPNATVEQRVATGFHRLNMMTREGGAQPREYLAKYQADRVRTVSTAWLGATMACCECHDHKYDPFTMRDFYAFSAYFADLRQWGVYQDYDYTPNPDLKGWSNDHPFPPEIEVDSAALHQRIQTLDARLQETYAAATRRLNDDPARKSRFRAWRESMREFLRAEPSGWVVPELISAEVRDGTAIQRDAAVVQAVEGKELRFQADHPTQDRLTLKLPAGTWSAFRLELLPRVPGQTFLRGDRTSASVSWQATIRRAGSTNHETLSFSFSEAEFHEPRYANGQDVLGLAGGWRTVAAQAREPQTGFWHLKEPLELAADAELHLVFPANAVARLRVAVSPFAFERQEWERLATQLPAAFRSDALLARPLAYAAFHRSVRADAETTRQLNALLAERRACREGKAWTMVVASAPPLVTRVLPRGNWMDESGPLVEPATPAFLSVTSGPAATAAAELSERDHEASGDADPARVRGSGSGSGRATRLDLAAWLVSRDNPLTARNVANRVWAQFFGAGLSARLEDLGAQGEWPTHPELLDWLAAEFMEPTGSASPLRGVPAPHAWDFQHLVRLIVTSHTYRQDAVGTAAAREADPANKWLARQSPRRLEAEGVRDLALAAAGLLQTDIGGPSVFPYQPAGYYANIQFPDRDYVASPPDLQYRRGIYMHWQRTFLHPMLANFDAPSREECVAGRLISNTPQQALTLLNDPTFVEASRVLAERILREERKDPARLEALFRRVLARPPRAAERVSLEEFLTKQRAAFAVAPAEAEALLNVGLAPRATTLPVTEVAAWANTARVVLNLHETITRY